MPFLPPRPGLLLALVLAALAAPALADDATDCLDRALTSEAQRAACDRAIPAAADDAARADLLSARARARRLLGDPESAQADADEARRLAPADADPLIEQGILLSDAGDHRGAMATLDRAVEAEPGYARGWLVLADVLGDAGENDRCVEAAGRTLAIDEGQALGWAFRGRCLLNAGRPREAVADLERATEIGIEEAQIHDNLALAYLRAGRAEDSLAAARQALALDPGHEGAQMSLQSALVATGAPEEAIAAYRAALATGIGASKGLANNLAWELYLFGHATDALAIIEQRLASHPEPSADQASEFDTYAHVLAALGRTDKAVASFLRAAELGGSGQRARYEARLAALGVPPGPGEGGFQDALRACAARGRACFLYN